MTNPAAIVVALAILVGMSDVVVINQGYSVRTSGSGRSRTTIEIRSEPLIHNLDPKALGKPVAEAIGAFIRDRLAAVTQRASDATIKAREAAARAFAGVQAQRQQASAARKAKAATKPTAPSAPKFGPKLPPRYGPSKPKSASGGVSKRYSGGRLGAMPPNQSDKLFHDSGRLIRSIATQAAKGAEWVINVAGNRFDPQTLNPGKDGSSEAALTRIIQKLHEIVPELADPARLMDSLPIRRALKTAQEAMIVKASARVEALKEQRARAIVSLLRSVA